MVQLNQLPEIVKSALEQNNIKLDGKSISINYPIRLGDLAEQIQQAESSTLNISEIELNLTKKVARKDGVEIDLTEKETALLSFLHSSREGVTKEEILEEVWGYSADTNTKTVETHLHRLNAKFQDSFGIKIVTIKDSRYKITA